MRRVQAEIAGFARRTVARVASASALASEWEPDLQFLVVEKEDGDAPLATALRRRGLPNIAPLWVGETTALRAPDLPTVSIEGGLVDGDVVAITPGRREVQVLLRESDLHHTVFLTNQCNSHCIMCSQPPSPNEDSWLVEEAKSVARHIRHAPAVLGFTGGEPTLLGSALREVLDTFVEHCPRTEFAVLTNGRRLSAAAFASDLLTGLAGRFTWMVPLYGHADLIHDEVVGAKGAFDQTIGGLLNLQSYRQPIQLRVVLVRPVLAILVALCEFIGRNLPFVREVALMGCEPVGFAIANRTKCEVDIADWTSELLMGIKWLHRAGIACRIMNVPLCGLPAELRPLACRSISDWKQRYLECCEGCAMRPDCCGVFSPHAGGWAPTKLQPLLVSENV